MTTDRSDEFIFGGAPIRGVRIEDPEPGSQFVRLSDDLAVADDFRATFTFDDPSAPLVHLRLNFDHGMPVCVDLRFEGQGERINGTTVREIPISACIREALAHAAFRFTTDEELAADAHQTFGGMVGRPVEVEGEQAWVYRAPDRSTWTDVEAVRSESASKMRRSRKGPPETDEELKELARQYREFVRTRTNPTQALADALYTTRPTVSRWLRKARDRGFLKDATPGKAGEAK